MLIKVLLAERNVTAYIDVEDLDGGVWDVQLQAGIKLAPAFILVLSNGTLDRCLGDVNYTDFLHKEIRSAVELQKRIVLVIDKFDWPNPSLLSPEINTALSYQGIE